MLGEVKVTLNHLLMTEHGCAVSACAVDSGTDSLCILASGCDYACGGGGVSVPLVQRPLLGMAEGPMKKLSLKWVWESHALGFQRAPDEGLGDSR